MADKVKFGISNVHYAILDGENNTYGTLVAIPGAVSLSLEPSGDTTPFYADNIQYFVAVANSGYTGDLEVAVFPEAFLKDVFGYTLDTTSKVMIENANIQPKSFALLFQEEGDVNGTKFVLYNCTCTRPTRELNTTTESVEPQTQTVSITASPLANGNSLAYTTAETPEATVNGWYTAVFTPTTGG